MWQKGNFTPILKIVQLQKIASVDYGPLLQNSISSNLLFVKARSQARSLVVSR